MGFDEVFLEITEDMPEGAEIAIYLSRGVCGMVMRGRNGDHLGEFSDGVLPDAYSAIFEALRICLNEPANTATEPEGEGT